MNVLTTAVTIVAVVAALAVGFYLMKPEKK